MYYIYLPALPCIPCFVRPFQIYKCIVFTFQFNHGFIYLPYLPCIVFTFQIDHTLYSDIPFMYIPSSLSMYYIHFQDLSCMYLQALPCIIFTFQIYHVLSRQG